MKEPAVLFALTATVAIYYAVVVTSVDIEGCNEAHCATNVSKCQLLGACGCTLDNCTCCANCSRCLKHQWEACCPCVGLCKLPNVTHDLASVSTIGNLRHTSSPSLFEAMVESAEAGESETLITAYRVTHQEEDVSLYRPPGLDGQSLISGLQGNVSEPQDNCLVVYFDQCIALEKCKRFCSSIGSSRYRWFHTACCECIGDTCISYGVNDALCKHCTT